MLICIVLVLVAIILQLIELQLFKVTSYQYKTEKVDENVTVCFLSDLHGRTYGKRLLQKIKQMKPDVIVIGGDVVSKKKPEELKRMIPFLKALSEVAKVYYCFGNHETTIDTVITVNVPERKADWDEYLQEIERLGIRILRNEGVEIADSVYLSGVELPDMFFVKQEMVELSSEKLKEIYEVSPKVMEENMYHLYVAHQPAYARVYETCSPDLILSGHTHGGLVRFPFIGSIISTELTFNPEFDGGRYHLSPKTDLIVSKGLGTHTYHIRILDRAEVVKIQIISCKEKENLVK